MEDQQTCGKHNKFFANLLFFHKQSKLFSLLKKVLVNQELGVGTHEDTRMSVGMAIFLMQSLIYAGPATCTQVNLFKFLDPHIECLASPVFQIHAKVSNSNF